MRTTLPIRNWRITEAEPSGLHLWFDEEREGVLLYELTPPVGERISEVSPRVDVGGNMNDLDSMVSVRGIEGEGEAFDRKSEKEKGVGPGTRDLPSVLPF